MSAHVADWPSTKELWTGMSGTGKTFLLTKIIRGEKARWKFVFDHKNNGEFARANELPACYSLDEMVRATAVGGWVCYNPIKEFPGEKSRGFEMFCEFVRELGPELRGRKLLVVDELQAVQHARREPLQLMQICDEGRTAQLDCYFVSSAPNRIHNAVRGQITKVYAFRLVEKNALNWLDENSFDTEKIRELKNGCYHWRNLDTGEAGEGGAAF